MGPAAGHACGPVLASQSPVLASQTVMIYVLFIPAFGECSFLSMQDADRD